MEILSKIAIDFIKYVKSFGFECYIVGGATRNYFLGIEPTDYDFTTSASLSDLLEMFKDYKTKLYSNKKTLGVVYKNKHYEITPYVNATLEDDINSRDFTMNSIMYSLDGFIDKYNGINDIKNKEIKYINKESILNDPIRMLRALRFRATYNLNVSEDLKSLILTNYSLINNVVKIKYSKELENILESKLASNIIDEYFPLFKELFPYISLHCLDNTYDNYIIRLAYLLKDDPSPNERLMEYGFGNKARLTVTSLIGAINYKALNDNDLKNLIYLVSSENIDLALKMLNLEGSRQKVLSYIENNELIFYKDLKIHRRNLKKLGYDDLKIDYIMDKLLWLVRNNEIENELDALKNYAIGFLS